MAGLFDPTMFSPYGGQMAGLLGNLPMWMMQPGQGDFAPTDMSGTGRAPMPLAPMPQPMPQVPAPAAPAAPQMGFLDRLGAGLGANSNTLLAMGAALLGGQGFGGAAQGAIAGRALDTKQRDRTMTEHALARAGLSPDVARVAAGNPALTAALLTQRLGLGGQTDDIKEYEFAKQQGFKGTFQDWIANKRAGAGEVGLNPVWGEDEKGNPVIGQLNKRGEFVRTKLPPGVTPSKGVDKIDLGTEWGVVSKVNGQLIGRYPKDIAGAEAEKARGKVQGGLQANLPTDLLTAEQTVRQIDELLNHEGLNSIVGQVDQFRPSWMLGDKGAEALARWEQLKGKSFLQAYQTLKGGGQITEVEGLKAENAMARMSRAQGEAEFKQALRDFRDAVVAGTRKLQEKAGVPASEITVPAGAAAPTNIRRYNPATGKIE